MIARRIVVLLVHSGGEKWQQPSGVELLEQVGRDDQPAAVEAAELCKDVGRRWCRRVHRHLPVGSQVQPYSGGLGAGDGAGGAYSTPDHWLGPAGGGPDGSGRAAA